MVELITWPSFFEPIKIGVFGDFLVHSYGGGGAKLVFLEKEFGQKRVFGKKIAPFFWWVLASLHCCCMIVTRCFRRVCQKTL